MLEEAQSEVDEVWDNYNMGLITNNERYNQIIDKWTYADNRITDNLDEGVGPAQARVQLGIYDAGLRCAWFEAAD
jgi:DNA-directed RNA polymerase beta' subunit